MIHNIGIDIIEVDRIRQAIEGNTKFIEKIFTASEIAYCQSKKNPYSYFSARFAAKEAFSKALQTGIANGIAFTDIEVSHHPSGAPYITTYGQTKKQLQEMGITHIFVSITHLKETAAATVVLEK